MSAIKLNVVAGDNGPRCSAQTCFEPALVTCDGPRDPGPDGGVRRCARPLCREHGTRCGDRDFCDPHVYVGLEDLGQQRLFE